MTIANSDNRSGATAEKLRKLVLHAETPEHERRSALSKLEELAAKRAVQRLRIPITRSARIGRQRRGVYINELDRLEMFALDQTIGEILASLSRCLIAVKAQPSGFDFGWDKARGPVVSITFSNRDVPGLEDLQQAVRETYLEGVVTKADRDVADETKLLVFLGSKRSGH